ncbi:MAG: hypothetical protein KKB88_00490 [Nanoarchaeota archaeon]|nr:hypothetical protein [Nanoarchaeota archaeon]
MKKNRKITKTERNKVIKTVLLYTGILLSMFSLQQWLLKSLPPIITILVGIAIIVFALWWWN